MKKTLKAVVSLALSAVVATSTALSAGGDFYTLQQVNFPIYSNGYLIEEGDLPTLSLNGNTYVPLRKLAESASVDVNWNNDTGAIEIDNTYATVDYLRKIALVEAEFETLYGWIIYKSERITLYSNDYHQSKTTASEAKEDIQDSLNNISKAASNANYMLNKCFPNGLDANYEYEKKLNDFIYNTNVCLQSLYDNAQLANDYIDGKYTWNYLLSKWKELDKQRHNSNPTSLNQRYDIIDLLSEQGY